MRTFDHLWQQDHLSDCDIVLTAQQSSSGTENGTCKLVSFPGHIILLSDSPFFSAQILRWQNKRQRGEGSPAQADQAADASTQPRRSTRQRRSTAHSGQQDHEQQQEEAGQEHEKETSSPASSSSRRPQLVLTLEHAEHQPAALEVLQVLYSVPEGLGLLWQLPQEQQLQAAIIADMWQVPNVGTAVADMLSAVADGELSAAVTDRLISMQAVPGCLEALLKKVLLMLLGDLEAVWADEALRVQLLSLPLHAMKLLLSFDEVKVASEDTVMFTARRYVDGDWKSPAALQLLPLVRCPHLSNYWLAAMAAPTCVELKVFPELLPKLTTLLAARINKTDYEVTPDDVTDLFAYVPASWAMPKRAITPVDSVQMTWELPIQQLREAVQRCMADYVDVKLRSPQATPPLSGIQYTCNITCKLKVGSCVVGVFVRSRSPAALWMPVTCSLGVPGTPLLKKMPVQLVTERITGKGWSDFFEVPMASGWDEAAWAAKGLPTSGTLPIKLTVFK